MTNKICSLLVCTLLFCGSAAAGQDAGEEQIDSAQIEWIDSFKDAQAEAVLENKLILLDFYSDT